ncbi:hypothetical protein [Synechocystis salina]|uniref:hypothetical protein n=1 Tax=Synechocystis salina TaxID=945780 RepID=UPI001D153280|nr:hypothetical protein [Synechocystis salina]
MSINFSNRLSAITTDSAGVTHIVWVEDSTLFHATYNDNSATWINETAIANVGSQKIVSLNLIANDKLIDDSGTGLPGLAVVYQQGSENESNIFYTAAQYNASGQTQWLDKPQALTADQVGDLEPRAIATEDGTVFVVGQKVNIENAQNQGIREDTDLYYQSFRINRSQFTTTSSSPPSSEKGTLARNVSGYSGQNSAVAASYSVLSDSEAEFLAKKAFQGIGLNWNTSSNLIANLSKFLLTRSPDSTAEGALRFLDSIEINIALQGSSGDNPTWSLFGGGVSTDGKLLLNAIASIAINGSRKDEGGGNFPKNKFQNRTQKSQQNTFEISLALSSLFSYVNKQGSDKSFPLSLETGALALTAGLQIPLFGTEKSIFRDIPLLSINAFGNIGFAVQWQLKPNSPNYSPLLGPYLSDKGLVVSDVLADVPEFSPFIAASSLLSDLIAAIEVDENKSPVSLESLLFAVNFTAGVDFALAIPFVLQGNGSLGLFFDGTFKAKGESDFPPDTFTLGLPLSLKVELLAGLISAKFSLFPTWTWPESSSQSLTLNPSLTSSASATEPSVQGSLLTIPFSTPLSPDLTLNPEDFTVQVTNANKTVSTIPVFGVIVQNNTVILRLEVQFPTQP